MSDNFCNLTTMDGAHMLGNQKPKLFSAEAKAIENSRRSQKQLELKARHFLDSTQNDLENLQNGVTQLRNLSNDINDLVNEQGDMLDIVSDDTQQSKQNIEQADDNIKDAKKHHRHCGCNVF